MFIKTVFIILSFLLFILPIEVNAVSIDASGYWNLNITEKDLISGAGSELKSEYRSVKNAVKLSIKAQKKWTVDVKKMDTNWPENFTLKVKKHPAATTP